jgi:prepilin-type N-terminal cleavage/methylation domain-containing protein
MKKFGFTMIELMVVVLIVAVLAAILIPYLTARLEAARWAEGKAGCGTLATAIRAVYAEQGEDFISSTSTSTYLTDSDLRGKFFSSGDYTITVSMDPLDTAYPLHYTISVGPPKLPTSTVTWTKAGYSLDYTGKWTELTTP